MASRRRRRKSLGGVVTNVESRVRRIEKRPGSKRLKTNVVSTEKIQPRAVVTKVIAQDAVTANEAAFGITLVTGAEPTDYLKEGLTWVDPLSGEAKVYSTDLSSFITYSDVTAQADASSALDAATAAQDTADGKNKVTYSTLDASGTGTAAGDVWWKYTTGGVIIGQWEWNGSSWVSKQIGNLVIASIDAGKITAGTISASIEMTSATITGGTVRTSSTGSRVELTNSDYIKFYDSSDVVTGVITPWEGAASGGPSGNFGVSIKGSETDEFPRFYVEGDNTSGILLMQTHYSGIIVEDASVKLSAGTTFSPDYSITIDTSGAYMTPSTAYGTQGLRNIRAVSSFTASTDTSGGVGDVILVYTP